MKRDIIMIGTSAGGVEAVPGLLGSLPAGIPAVIFVTLHISPHNESLLPRIIERNGCLPAEHPRDGARPEPGKVYVAPPDHHLLLGPGVIRLSRGPRENRHRPAIDPMFRTAAEAYGSRVAGVLLTGNLDDGVAGLQEIKRRGGLTIVQDPAEAQYPGMPLNALAAFEVDECLSLKEIESLIKSIAEPGTRGRKMKQGRSQRGKRDKFSESIARPPEKGAPGTVVCPDCRGPLWEIRDGKLVRFQCLVGHRYSLESLMAAQAEETEQALWVALRTLEERVALQRRLSADHEKGSTTAGRMFAARAAANEKHALLLRKLLQEFGSRGRR